MFEGEWKNNRPDGKGKITYSDGKTAEGIFKDGKIWDGTGYAQEWVFPDKGKSYLCKYEGEWKNGKYCGSGELRRSDGIVYTGEWQDGKYDGKGKIQYADGSVYEGEWRDGKRCGQGSHSFFVNDQRAYYRGSWQEDMKQGYGELWTGKEASAQNCDGYAEGEWEKNILKSGVFINKVSSMQFRVVNGRTQVPELEGNGFTADFATRIIADGRYEMIYYKDDGITIGIYIYKEEQMAVDEWTAQGWFYGRIKYPDGKYYKGNLDGGFVPHGTGSMTYPDGTVKKGLWDDGILKKELKHYNQPSK